MKRNSLIDFVKLGLALLVVCLHFPTFTPSNIIMPIARIGVPLYFMFSGYFMGVPKAGTDLERAKKNIKTSFKYMLFGLAVLAASVIVYMIYTKGGGVYLSKIFEGYKQLYAPVLGKTGFFQYLLLPLVTIAGFAVFNLPDALGVWYVIALFVTALIHYVFVKTNKQKLYPYIAGVLLVAALLLGQYSRFIGLGHLPAFITRNAILTGFPMFALGFWFAQKQTVFKTNWKYLILAGGLVFMLLQPLENSIVDPEGLSGGRLYISTLIACVLIFLFTISTPLTVNTKFLDPRLVFNIYIFHQSIGGLLQELMLGYEARGTALITFFATLALFELIYLVLTFIKKQIKNENAPKKVRIYKHRNQAVLCYNTVMEKKVFALLLILILYAAAFAAAAGVIILLNNYIDSAILLLFIGDVVATVVVWLFGVIIKNSSVYDPYWSVQPLCVVLGFYFLTGTPFISYHLFALIPLGFWAVRLTLNWVLGFDDLKWQDWRYVKLKEDNPKLWPIINFFGINMMPTILVFAGTVPILQYIEFLYISDIALSSIPPFGFKHIMALLGGAVALGAAILQTIADKQLSDFKKLKTGEVMDKGLWRHSRHPNYLGEVSLWWGFFIMAIPAFTYLTIIGAAAITLLFNFISIPLMEKRLKDKPGYAEYRATVSRILLLPRKK